MHFTDVVENRIEKIRSVLLQKEKEYARGNDRYHNFNVAGRKLNTTPERALLGMMIKHIVSVEDMIDTLDQNNPNLSLPTIDEKIGDTINYLILLEGMLIKRAQKEK